MALLLHHMGPQCLEIFNSFNDEIDAIKFEDLMKKFELHFIPRVNLAIERHVFFTRRQNASESIAQYATVLENLSKSCEFEALREGVVKDIFICGLRENFRNVKERLLSEGPTKWKRPLEIAKRIDEDEDEAMVAATHYNTLQLHTTPTTMSKMWAYT